MDIKSVASAAEALIRETGEFVKNERKSWHIADVKRKIDTSLVTAIDVASEQRLVAGLKKILPGSDVLAEEQHNTRPDNELIWIIDPIDGTTNFVHNLPLFCISVALMSKGKVIFGIVYEINNAECFRAHEGEEGAFLNGKRIYVSEAPVLKECLLATGFPSNGFDILEEYINTMRAFMQNTQGMRRLGTAALDLAYVACGRCDGFFEYRLKPWDVAAGAYIVIKAGGAVTTFSGGDDYIFGGEMLATNGVVHKETIEFMAKHKGN